jgi:hypothetical protein
LKRFLERSSPVVIGYTDPGIFLEGLRRTTKNHSEDNKCADRVSKQVFLGCNFETLPLEPTKDRAEFLSPLW